MIAQAGPPIESDIQQERAELLDYYTDLVDKLSDKDSLMEAMIILNLFSVAVQKEYWLTEFEGE